ncbi:hypothetical protein MSAN_02525000 [Mycena sanguinolenta]|uniref:Uncharacterized protein n=1 Tax=Mycena sanguinolenta TaxID=230812 RepID=A0A8H6TV48_9AGAR|nr:hypothetical protein MSAN_02525000 [Mycena sanguinolenta]
MPLSQGWMERFGQLSVDGPIIGLSFSLQTALERSNNLVKFLACVVVLQLVLHPLRGSLFFVLVAGPLEFAASFTGRRALWFPCREWPASEKSAMVPIHDHICLREIIAHPPQPHPFHAGGSELASRRACGSGVWDVLPQAQYRRSKARPISGAPQTIYTAHHNPFLVSDGSFHWHSSSCYTSRRKPVFLLNLALAHIRRGWVYAPILRVAASLSVLFAADFFLYFYLHSGLLPQLVIPATHSRENRAGSRRSAKPSHEPSRRHRIHIVGSVDLENKKKKIMIIYTSPPHFPAHSRFSWVDSRCSMPSLARI